MESDAATVGPEGTTYVPVTNPATNQPLLKYYSLRVTIPHVQSGKLWDVLSKYSRNFCMALHNADSELAHEHIHVAILDLDSVSKVEALRKALKKDFGRQGNGFIAGKFMDNHIYKALQYFKHDEYVTFKHRGPHWQVYIDESPDWEKPTEIKKSSQDKRKAESFPMFSFSNIYYRALSHRDHHQIVSDDLGVILEHMQRTTNWIPSPQMTKNGLDPYCFKLFKKFCAKDRLGPTVDWWTPRFV